METQVKYSPSFAMAAVTLAPNEVVKAELAQWCRCRTSISKPARRAAS